MTALVQTSEFCPRSGTGCKEYHIFVRVPQAGAPLGEHTAATALGEQMAATPLGEQMAATPSAEQMATPRGEHTAATAREEQKAMTPFEEQMAAVVDALESIAAGKVIRFVRFFLSDAANQQPALADYLAAHAFTATLAQRPITSPAQQPAMASAANAQQPAMASAANAQQPAMASAANAQQPAMASAANAQQPAIASDAAPAQQPPYPISYIQQPPLDGTKLAAWVYATDKTGSTDATDKTIATPTATNAETTSAHTATNTETTSTPTATSTETTSAPAATNTATNAATNAATGTTSAETTNAAASAASPLDLVWDAYMTSPDEGSLAQMSDIFGSYGRRLQERGLSVAQDCIRTWIYVHDVDVNYGGVVKGRKDYFDTIGLTPDTHFIASTGIEGRHPEPLRFVTMDAVAARGLKPGQIQHLYAKDHLSPTADYGVTFERGTAVHFEDRTHAYISGTASIDSKGQVLFPGDVRKQTLRMLENISALLAETDATLSDIAMAIVYLRDTADYLAVKSIIDQQCPGLNAEFVLAPVCRPAWLVEMECIAII